MNISKCYSSLHYDANHNLLCLVKGGKTVILISPSYTHLLKALPAYFSSPNHSNLTKDDLMIFTNTFSSDQSNSKIGIYKVSLSPGDVLFIPEGWWHAVESDRCSYAVNYWFESPLKQFFEEGKANHMASYLLRAATYSLKTNEGSDNVCNLYQTRTVAPPIGDGAIVDNKDKGLDIMRKRKQDVENDKDKQMCTRIRRDESERNSDFSLLMCELFHSAQQKKGEDSSYPDTHESLCLRFVGCSFEHMALFWLPYAHKVIYSLLCYSEDSNVYITIRMR
jgi:hypothetical protein